MAEMRSNSADTRDLLLSILNIQSERQQLVDMQKNGQHIAEQVMAAGQEVIYPVSALGLLNNQIQLLRQSRDRNITMGDTPSIHDSQRFLQYQRDLVTLHRETGIPPTIKRLDGEVTRTSELAVAGGMYSDIWMGLWLGEEKVCHEKRSTLNIPFIGPSTTGRFESYQKHEKIRSDDKEGRWLILSNTTVEIMADQRFENEINMWAVLKHKNILTFYGIVTDLGQHIHMVRSGCLAPTHVEKYRCLRGKRTAMYSSQHSLLQHIHSLMLIGQICQGSRRH